MARQADLDLIADIHSRAFPQSFLACLGMRAVKKYYGHFLNFQDRIVVVVEVQDQVIGFAVGWGRNISYMRDLTAALGKTLLLGLIRLVVLHPARVLQKIAQSTSLGQTVRLRLSRSVDAEIGNSADASYRLLVIAVRDGHHGRGASVHLLDAFTNQCRSFGISSVFLTVEACNQRARRFYERHGWKEAVELEGRSVRYLLLLGDASPKVDGTLDCR